MPAALAQGAPSHGAGGALPGMAAPRRLHGEPGQWVRGCRARVSRAASVCGVSPPICVPTGGLGPHSPPHSATGAMAKSGVQTSPGSHPTCSGCASKCSCTEGCPCPAAGSRVGAPSTTPSPMPEPPQPQHVAPGLQGGQMPPQPRCEAPQELSGQARGQWRPAQGTRPVQAASWLQRLGKGQAVPAGSRDAMVMGCCRHEYP